MNARNMIPIILLLFISVNIQAQIQLTMPSLTGIIGSEAVVDFTVNDLTQYHIQGYQFKIHFDPEIISLSDPKNNQIGTLSNGALIQISSNVKYLKTGYINVVSIKGSDYTGSGALFSLKVKFLKPGKSAITLTSNDDTFTNKIFNNNLQNVNLITSEGSVTSKLLSKSKNEK